jgi:hypothetical protein
VRLRATWEYVIPQHLGATCCQARRGVEQFGRAHRICLVRAGLRVGASGTPATSPSSHNPINVTRGQLLSCSDWLCGNTSRAALAHASVGESRAPLRRSSTARTATFPYVFIQCAAVSNVYPPGTPPAGFGLATSISISNAVGFSRRSRWRGFVTPESGDPAGASLRQQSSPDIQLTLLGPQPERALE